MARRSRFNPISLALGYAFAASLGQAAEANAESDPFGIVDLPSGYQLASAEEGKGGEGKCGEGKSDEGKCGEGKCGGGSEEGKDAEGKCGEGKCGGAA